LRILTPILFLYEILSEDNKFIKQVERARHNLTGEVFSLCFCYRARPEVQQAAQKAGIHLLFSYGKLLYPLPSMS
jgi:hypothetical protein